ncbi:hypothetical protein B0H17DRAFT_5722 [Mycena rosella]|uniref:Uncharacterized protein n=1 Tax=Mycena rosella TaxID=1033263 RepID=A0AAD7MCP4_MYCRO|nr:hypothetical protein B0H17DRAFT_5722 [Mycena rosella]
MSPRSRTQFSILLNRLAGVRGRKTSAPSGTPQSTATFHPQTDNINASEANPSTQWKKTHASNLRASAPSEFPKSAAREAERKRPEGLRL